MSKISGDLIKEIENRAINKEIKEIAIALLEQIGENSSDEYLRKSIMRQVDSVVREEVK